MLDYKMSIDKVVSNLPNIVIHQMSDFGINLQGSGEGVRICLIDSGAPDHEDLSSNMSEVVNFSNSPTENDIMGHATVLAGIISSNKPYNIVGLSPNSLMYYAKMSDDTGQVRFDSFIASILWAIIQEVDVIVIAMSTGVDNQSLHDAIKKANDNGICVICSGDPESFPAKYKETFSVGVCGTVNIKTSSIYSTYIEQEFAECSGQSVGIAVAASACALIVEATMKAGKKIVPKEVYEILKEHLK
jgi:hypothetical protein